MKALVISDSHGSLINLYKVLHTESDCKTVFFLGDGLSDIEKAKEDFPDFQFICVKGNNDWGHDDDLFAYKYIDGCTIVATHGHTLSVRYGLDDLIDKVCSVRGNVALYGHTHFPEIRTDSSRGIYIVNPGALKSGRYAVLEINNGDCFGTLKSIEY